ncbi:DEAD/DEAH box helicase [Comamonas aquatica]|uniref:DEAD/DEAH box helicase n=1 Tax=Comamonas aquatica TaxID=225991 RepID=UPI00244D70DD|nr:DEAD/DEAH box helicase [Comamonas aquatica]MDH0382368.1 DEAD/DEAH box helicase [Comamonas aquatica]MDH0430509.1 DEAD/DEAH box helicase [Comamonas aquatica]MDH0941443.1 DEAD/DEAH box helicase [Comamonas aquatica]
MTLLAHHIEKIENHWAVQALPEEMRALARSIANENLVKTALGCLLKNETQGQTQDQTSVLTQVATAYELAAIENLSAILTPAKKELNQEAREIAQAASFVAFGLYRGIPIPENVEQRLFHVLHMASLAYVGDRWTDLRRWLSDSPNTSDIPSFTNVSWDQRLLYRLFECWIRLLRKNNWDDLQQVSKIILELRDDQVNFESELLSKTKEQGTSVALRLIALYHFARATERLAVYMLQGNPPAIGTELDQHFEAAIKASQGGRDTQLEMILRWLHVASKKMVAGSLWWIAHAGSSRVSKFISHLTKHRGFFELLPPQRIALQDEGLLDPLNRAVIVDMPTSGGKTQLAQFRMLQALNQFSQDDGWVAYVAPTRALVAQITRRLRTDFENLGIHVEQLSGALEIDAFEEALLNEDKSFQILVCTPEKLQLVLRNKKIARPLALLVMDEAHNIEDIERGLRIELLLATVKQESPHANFLLLMPFVPNAQDLAQWLGSERGRAISLSSTAWQPNERIVGMFDIQKGEKRGDWKLTFETLTTTQKTINLQGKHAVDGNKPLADLSFTEANSLSTQAVAMAKVFSKRGTSIAVAQKIPDTWNIARKVSKSLEPFDKIPEEVSLVQRFLATEISPDFELIEMLSKGVTVHHAGLPTEVLSLIEWLTEIGHIKVMCATTTIAQGLNFPVSSVFLASTKYPYGVSMSHRAFWNLAGRAGRIGQDSVGVIGIAAGTAPNDIRKYVSSATGELISRLESLLNELHTTSSLSNLTQTLMQDQWSDFRSYIAHLWNEKRNLDTVISEAEQTLRNTFGFGALRSKGDPISNEKADALLDATRNYVRELARHPENASLADSTGFSPEGVRTALLEMNKLENKLSIDDWQASSIFGENKSSILPDLMGIMMQIPQIKKGLEEIKGDGIASRKLADITRSWVAGKSIADIAAIYFNGNDLTEKLSKACKAIYRDLANNGSWGLSALSKLPTSGLNFEKMEESDRRKLNNLPAMLYHGVKSEEGVLMRMNSVPRSIAESIGEEFKSQKKDITPSSKVVADYLKKLSSSDWERLRPESSKMTGKDYKEVWQRLSGL